MKPIQPMYMHIEARYVFIQLSFDIKIT